jgi:hypothetical protein
MGEYRITHTPTPWVCHSGMVWKADTDVFPNGPEDGIPIARADRDTEFTTAVERDANVNFIVHACNLFDDFVLILDAVDKRIDLEAERTAELAKEGDAPPGFADSYMLAGYRNDIKALLAKAKSLPGSVPLTYKLKVEMIDTEEEGENRIHDMAFTSESARWAFIDGLEHAIGWQSYEIIDEDEVEG